MKNGNYYFKFNRFGYVFARINLDETLPFYIYIYVNICKRNLNFALKFFVFKIRSLFSLLSPQSRQYQFAVSINKFGALQRVF